MNNFSRKNLNNIKSICSEKTGVELPEKRPIGAVKLTSIIIAIALVLTPLTAYATQYTMNFFEYRDSEKNVKAEALKFVNDFMDFAYSNNDIYEKDDGSENSFYDFLKQSAYLFKNDNYQKTVYNLGYSVNEEIKNYVTYVKNDGNSWYITVNSDVEEYSYKSGTILEYIITFYLKYEGSGEYFVLTDMYFHDSLGHSDYVFGEVGSLDMNHFIAWAQNNDDYSKYIAKMESKTIEVAEKDRADRFAYDFAVDYISYVHGQDEPFAGKEGDIYKVIDVIEEYVNVTDQSESYFRAKESQHIQPVSSRVEKIKDAWYAECRVHGELVNSEGVRYTDYGNSMYLKFKESNGEYIVEDFYVTGANSDGYKIFFGSGENQMMGFKTFVDWADETDDYSEYVRKGVKKIDDYVINSIMEEQSLKIFKDFVNAAFLDGENVWDNGNDDSVTVFIREFVDFLKVSGKKDNIDNYTVRYEEYANPQRVDNLWYASKVIHVIENRTDGTKFNHQVKLFVIFEYDGKEYEIKDLYFYGNLDQCSEIFDKVGATKYSFDSDEMFFEWAEKTNDYSTYIDRVRASAAKYSK